MLIFRRNNFKFVPNDAGRGDSRRSKQRNDCSVRSLSIVTGAPYDVIYDLLASAGRSCSRGFDFRKWINSQKIFRFTYLSFPAEKNKARMNPVDFCREYGKGRYIVRTAKHVFAVIDGVVMDTAKPRPDRCIYCAWRLEKKID